MLGARVTAFRSLSAAVDSAGVDIPPSLPVPGNGTSGTHPDAMESRTISSQMQSHELRCLRSILTSWHHSPVQTHRPATQPVAKKDTYRTRIPSSPGSSTCVAGDKRWPYTQSSRGTTPSPGDSPVCQRLALGLHLAAPADRRRGARSRRRTTGAAISVASPGYTGWGSGLVALIRTEGRPQVVPGEVERRLSGAIG